MKAGKRWPILDKVVVTHHISSCQLAPSLKHHLTPTCVVIVTHSTYSLYSHMVMYSVLHSAPCCLSWTVPLGATAAKPRHARSKWGRWRIKGNQMYVDFREMCLGNTLVMWWRITVGVFSLCCAALYAQHGHAAVINRPHSSLVLGKIGENPVGAGNIIQFPHWFWESLTWLVSIPPHINANHRWLKDC